MPLQRINWTQINTESVPTGYTVDIGQFGTGTSVNGVHTNELSIVGVNFFDYLNSIGYTGVTPINIFVADNAGLSLEQETSGKTISTIYNTALDSALSTPSTVGGIVAGTTVSQLTGKTFVSFVDDLLFPTVSPTYTIPTITMSGSIATGTYEVGYPFSKTVEPYGTKNDAGGFTQFRILEGLFPIWTDPTLSTGSTTNIPSQFGYSDPNNPNIIYGSDEPPYLISYNIVEPSGSGTSTTKEFKVDGNYNAGLPKQDNKGNYDTRTSAVRSVNAPQAASTFFTSSIVTITGQYPYFWGKMSSLPTISSIASAISGGTANKVMSPSASGTLTITYNASSEFIWFAYYQYYTEKTKWYVNALDNGSINGSFISTAATVVVNSPDSYWTGKGFKAHWSVYATTQTTIEFRNT